LLWSFALTTVGAFNPTTPSSRSRGVIAATSSGVIAREYSTSVWGFFLAAVGPAGLARRDTPVGVCRIASIRDSIRRRIAIASPAARCFRRLPQRNRRCRLIAGIPRHSATGSVGSASRHDQPRQQGAADVPQAHASPAAPAAYAPGRPELGTTEHCACERVSRYRSDRWGRNILD
jgi:hypothetical protein